MSQETWILKCYCCKIFQIHLKKKAKRWQCKVCGAKQDLMKIFYKGHPSECRINVQIMNNAEGKVLALQEQYLDEHKIKNDECEYVLQKLQNENDIIYNNLEKTIKKANEQVLTDNNINFQKNIQIQDFIHDIENLKNENVVALVAESSDINNHSNMEIYNTNSIDFSAKTLNSNLSKKIIAKMDLKVPKLSIFESNDDIDECLNF